VPLKIIFVLYLSVSVAWGTEMRTVGAEVSKLTLTLSVRLFPDLSVAIALITRDPSTTRLEVVAPEVVVVSNSAVQVLPSILASTVRKITPSISIVILTDCTPISSSTVPLSVTTPVTYELSTGSRILTVGGLRSTLLPSPTENKSHVDRSNTIAAVTTAPRNHREYLIATTFRRDCGQTSTSNRKYSN